MNIKYFTFNLHICFSCNLKSYHHFKLTKNTLLRVFNKAIVLYCIVNGGLGKFPKSQFFPTKIMVGGLEILPYEHSSLVIGMKAG